MGSLPTGGCGARGQGKVRDRIEPRARGGRVPVSEDRQAELARRLLAGALGQEDERPMRLTMERGNAVLTFDDVARGET